MGEIWTVLGVILIILGVCGLTAGQVYISVMKKRIREDSEDDSYYEEAVSYYREARTAYRQAGSPEDSSMAELEDYMES